MSKDLVCVGAITGSFGVRGEVRIKSFCGDPEAIETYSPLVSEDSKDSFTLSLVGQVKGGYSARIVEVKTKEQGDKMKGTRLYARRDQLPTLPDDEFYYSDLMGLTVVDTGGVELGRVKAVQNHGADDLLEILPKGGGQSPLIPFTKAIVPTVDLAAKRIIVDPPEGLLG